MKDMQRSKLIEKMQSAAFYPHEVDHVEHKQTHISDVFLAGKFVYKLKKPVDTGFLDFTTLEKRRQFCKREVDLNRRLTTDIYLSVENITQNGKVYELAGSGDCVDYAVKMKRLNDADNLQSMLRNNKADKDFLIRLTDVLVNFYRHSESSARVDSGGNVDQILANCTENFSQLKDSAESLIDSNKIEVIKAATENFVRRHQDLFLRRIEEGRINDCHGDLKAEHIYDDHGVQIIDCIEFNNRFRYQDTAADLAFLAMDMDYLDHPSKALFVLSRYVRKSGDKELMRLIDFYKCYRAMVQAKVHALQLETLEKSAAERRKTRQALERYIDLAYHYAVKMMQPILWVVCGLTATGKSTVAKNLAELFSISLIRSDQIRKATFQDKKDNFDNRFGEGMYSATATSLVYAKMLLSAQAQVQTGKSVIIDATFRNRQDRANILKLAEDCHVSVIFIECRCAEEEIKRRLKARDGGDGLSDARLEHWEKIKSSTDPFTEISADKHIRLATEQPIERCLEDIVEGMYRLLAEQVSYQQA